MGAPCVNIFEYPLRHRLNLTNLLLIPHSSFSSDEKKTYKLFTWGVWAWWAWWLISFTGWVTTWMPSSFFALHCKMVQKRITIMKQNTSKSYMCTLIITLERLPFQISTLNSKPLTVHQLPAVEWLDFSMDLDPKEDWRNTAVKWFIWQRQKGQNILIILLCTIFQLENNSSLARLIFFLMLHIFFYQFLKVAQNIIKHWNLL